MKLYRTEAERELLPEEDLEFVTSTLTDDEFLIIAVREELYIVADASIESWEALGEAEFERKFGITVEQSRHMWRRIGDTIGSARRHKPLEEPPVPIGRQGRTNIRIYCSQDEFEQLDVHNRYFYGTSPDVESGEDVFAVTIKELETYIALIAVSLEAVGNWEFGIRTDFTAEYARSIMKRLKRIVQELRPHMPNSTVSSETTQRHDVARHSKIRHWLSVFSSRDQ